MQESEVNERFENIARSTTFRNIQSEYDRLISLGGEAHEAPSNVGGELMVASVYDPWGNVIGIIYNPAFKLS